MTSRTAPTHRQAIVVPIQSGTGEPGVMPSGLNIKGDDCNG